MAKNMLFIPSEPHLWPQRPFLILTWVAEHVEGWSPPLGRWLILNVGSPLKSFKMGMSGFKCFYFSPSVLGLRYNPGTRGKNPILQYNPPFPLALLYMLTWNINLPLSMGQFKWTYPYNDDKDYLFLVRVCIPNVIVWL